MKSGGADQNIVLDSLLQILSLPSRLHDTRYWKLFFKLCGCIKSLSDVEDPSEEDVPSETYSDLNLLSLHISHQGLHDAAFPLWKRYLEAVVRQKEPRLVISSLEALLSVPIHGASALIEEYLDHSILSTVESDLLERKEAIKGAFKERTSKNTSASDTSRHEKLEVMNVDEDETIASKSCEDESVESKKIESWRSLPGEVKALVFQYSSDRKTREEEITVEKMEENAKEDRKLSDKCFFEISEVCRRAGSVIASGLLKGSDMRVRTMGLDGEIYMLERALQYAFRTKSYLLARRIVLHLASLLATMYRSVEHYAIEHELDETTLKGEISGNVFLQLFLDLRAFVEAEMFPHESLSIYSVLLDAHFAAEYYGPTLEADTRDASFSNAKMVLFDYLASLGDLNPLPPPEIVRSILYYSEGETQDVDEAIDQSDSLFLDLCIQEWSQLITSTPSHSPPLLLDALHLFTLIIYRERKLFKKCSSHTSHSSERLLNTLNTIMNIPQSHQYSDLVLLSLGAWKYDLKNETQFSKLYDSSLNQFAESPIVLARIEHLKVSTYIDVTEQASETEFLVSFEPFTVPASPNTVPFEPDSASNDKKRKRVDDLPIEAEEDRSKRVSNFPTSPSSSDSNTSPVPPKLAEIVVIPEEGAIGEDVARASVPSLNTAAAAPEVSLPSPSTSSPPSTNNWAPRFYPPALPQHDLAISLSASFVNALMPRQSAIPKEPEVLPTQYNPFEDEISSEVKPLTPSTTGLITAPTTQNPALTTLVSEIQENEGKIQSEGANSEKIEKSGVALSTSSMDISPSQPQNLNASGDLLSLEEQQKQYLKRKR